MEKEIKKEIKKDTKKEIKKDTHGLTPKQFEQWELSEVSLEMFKKDNGIK